MRVKGWLPGEKVMTSMYETFALRTHPMQQLQLFVEELEAPPELTCDADDCSPGQRGHIMTK